MRTKQAAETDCQIRWMILRDMPNILAIEKRAFDFPWDEADFKTALKRRSCIGMVAEEHEAIVGYFVYDLCDGFIHVLNLAVDPTHARRGIGTKLITRLIEKISQQRRTRICMEVRESNLGAQLFLKNQGFVAQCIVKNHYCDTGEESYRFEYELPECGIPTFVKR
jgi:ribosomal-protein-alanine N-acetyltransferase